MPVSPAVYSINADGTEELVVKKENDEECGYMPPVEPLYRWRDIDPSIDYICDECDEEPQPPEPQETDYILTITYSDSSEYQKQCSYSPQVTQSDTNPSDYELSAATEIVIGQCASEIGENAFSGATSLSSITIPSTVTIIGEGAFRNCPSLEGVSLPQIDRIETQLFSGCSSLSSISIPSSVTSIGVEAFKGCSSLSTVTIPSTIAVIASGAFNGCSSLSSINLPQGIMTIGDGAFQGCTSLSTVTIPSTITNIGVYTFNGCSSLSTVTIGSNVREIGMGAFGGTNLSTLTIPSSVTSIGSGALPNTLGEIQFDGITPPTIALNLLNGSYPIYVPCEAIDDYKEAWSTYAARIGGRDCAPTVPSGTSFYAEYSNESPYSAECTSFDEELIASMISPEDRDITQMTKAVVGDCVTSLGNYCFMGCTSLSSVTLSSSVRRLSAGAFMSCSSLVSINIPQGVTSLSYGTFANCTSLTSIVLPSNLEIINTSTFYGCTSLTSVDIPSRVTLISESAFNGCTSLTSITVRATTPPSVDEYTFDNTNNCPIKVPNGLVSAYKSAWGQYGYADRITSI